MKKILKIRQGRGGFTLVELLVVIAIIAILTGIVVTNLSPAKAKARDAKRVSDIGQVQLALELYFDRCRTYPPVENSMPDPDSDTGCGVTFSQFMSTTPKPPGTNADDTYKYYLNGESTDYILRTVLETNASEALNDSLTSNPYGADSCASDADTFIYCLGPK